METQTFPAGASPRVMITAGQGALNIEFWDQRDFAVESVAGGAISQADAALVIHEARGDMRRLMEVFGCAISTATCLSRAPRGW